jgi:hypothetical protein
MIGESGRCDEPHGVRSPHLRHSVLYRLRDVRGVDRLRAIQVGHSARHADHVGAAARADAQPLLRGEQQLFRLGCYRAQISKGRLGNGGVPHVVPTAAEAPPLQFASAERPPAKRHAGLPRGVSAQRVGVDRPHGDVDGDPIEQRTRDLREVLLYL